MRLFRFSSLIIFIHLNLPRIRQILNMISLQGRLVQCIILRLIQNLYHIFIFFRILYTAWTIYQIWEHQQVLPIIYMAWHLITILGRKFVLLDAVSLLNSHMTLVEFLGFGLGFALDQNVIVVFVCRHVSFCDVPCFMQVVSTQFLFGFVWDLV